MNARRCATLNKSTTLTSCYSLRYESYNLYIIQYIPLILFHSVQISSSASAAQQAAQAVQTISRPTMCSNVRGVRVVRRRRRRAHITTIIDSDVQVAISSGLLQSFGHVRYCFSSRLSSRMRTTEMRLCCCWEAISNERRF